MFCTYLGSMSAVVYTQLCCWLMDRCVRTVKSETLKSPFRTSLQECHRPVFSEFPTNAVMSRVCLMS